MTTPNHHGTYVQIPITVAKNSTIAAHFFYVFKLYFGKNGNTDTTYSPAVV